jgi:hypothetical protein
MRSVQSQLLKSRMERDAQVRRELCKERLVEKKALKIQNKMEAI